MKASNERRHIALPDPDPSIALAKTVLEEREFRPRDPTIDQLSGPRKNALNSLPRCCGALWSDSNRYSVRRHILRPLSASMRESLGVSVL